MCPAEAKPRDAQWQRVQDLMTSYVEARTRGSVDLKQRDELFEALYTAFNKLALKIVKDRAPNRNATPISEEVVARVWNKSSLTDLMDRFKPNKGDAFSWFYTMLAREWVNWVRHAATQGDPITLGPEDWELLLKKMAEQLVEMPVGHPLGSLPPSPDEALQQKQESDALYLALEALTPRQRDLLRLRRAEDLTIAQCAERVGVSQATVERELQKAVAIVKNFYGERRS